MHTHETIEEARRLWRNINRRNLMVKVPGTKPGLPAIRTLIGEGINVNVTLLFSQKVYEEVAEAYIAGLEDFVAKGGDPHKVASVASFFVSRIDTLVDEALDKRIAATPDAAEKQQLTALKGKVAIANAKLAYQAYQRIFGDERWQRARAEGGADAAPAMGQHRHQKPVLQRRAVCRGADRTGHGQYDAAGDDGCVPRSRHAARQPRRGCRRRAGRDGCAVDKPASRSTRSRRGSSRTASNCSPTRPTSSMRRCRRSAARCSAASSMRCRTSCPRSWTTVSRRRSKTGARKARCGGYGPATLRCGPRPTRPTGSAG